jgi:hypothetical protein
MEAGEYRPLNDDELNASIANVEHDSVSPPLFYQLPNYMTESNANYHVCWQQCAYQKWR